MIKSYNSDNQHNCIDRKPPIENDDILILKNKNNLLNKVEEKSYEINDNKFYYEKCEVPVDVLDIIMFKKENVEDRIENNAKINKGDYSNNYSMKEKEVESILILKDNKQKVQFGIENLNEKGDEDYSLNVNRLDNNQNAILPNIIEKMFGVKKVNVGVCDDNNIGEIKKEKLKFKDKSQIEKEDAMHNENNGDNNNNNEQYKVNKASLFNNFQHKSEHNVLNLFVLSSLRGEDFIIADTTTIIDDKTYKKPKSFEFTYKTNL